MDVLLVLAGLVALFAGGESLVAGAVRLAARLGLSPLVIGLTVVGFGTSAPELVVSIDAALSGVPDIAMGNVVGSNIGNVLLILGLCALLRPLPGPPPGIGRDSAAMVGAALLLLPLAVLGEVGRPAGAVLLALLALYLAASLRAARRSDLPDPAVAGRGPDLVEPRRGETWRALARVAAGLGLLVLGAGWLVEGAVSLARAAGLSEAFIGLTIVAVGTSLPELATGLVAVMRRQGDIALANVVGSNIFNVLGILGATALIAPIAVAPRFATLDVPVMLAASLALAAAMHWRVPLGRPAGAISLLLYAGYLWLAQG